MQFSFDSFVNSRFDYDPVSETHTCLWLREEKMDIGGGKIRIEDIDRLKDYPNTDVVTISGLHQATFEYFIKTYGRQFKAIRFLKISLLRIGHCSEPCLIWNMCISFLIKELMHYGI